MTAMSENFLSPIRRYFDFSRHETDFYTEITAGISTYLALSYIFVVNPAILGAAGINADAVLFATVVASCLGTLAMGLWAKLPFAVAPGLEMNGFFTFVVCKEMGLSWQQALVIVLLSGVVNILFTTLQIRRTMIDTMPPGLKRALATTVGAFVATIGLQLANIVSYKSGLLEFSALSYHLLITPEAGLLYLGFAISFLLYFEALSFPFGIFVAVLVCSVLSFFLHIGVRHGPAPENMFSGIFKLDLSVLGHLADLRYWSPIIVFFVVDFVGGAGKLMGLSAMTDIQDGKGNVRNLPRALYVDGAATVLGALLGTSSLVAFVESAVGIRAGGRTGLAAVVCALLIGLSLWLEPLLRFMAPEATTGVMLFVGYLLSPWKVDPTGSIKHTSVDTWVGVLMGAVAFLTFGIDKAMAVGFWFYFIKELRGGAQRRSVTWLGVIAIVLTITSILQYAGL